MAPHRTACMVKGYSFLHNNALFTLPLPGCGARSSRELYSHLIVSFAYFPPIQRDLPGNTWELKPYSGSLEKAEKFYTCTELYKKLANSSTTRTHTLQWRKTSHSKEATPVVYWQFYLVSRNGKEIVANFSHFKLSNNPMCLPC